MMTKTKITFTRKVVDSKMLTQTAHLHLKEALNLNNMLCDE